MTAEHGHTLHSVCTSLIKTFGLHLETPAASFNLDLEKPTVYNGPEGSYFGYSLDFYHPTQDKNVMSVLVGAPKANTSQPGIVEGGAVYYCPWPASDPDSCRQIPFDKANNRMIKVNGTREPLEFKSHQWFGASVRTHKDKVVACAPLYHWRTVKVSSEMDPVGTCYVAVQNFSAYAEYSPCRTNNPDPEGQGFCQAGFSVDFTKVTNLPPQACQVITAGVAEILNGYSLKTILRKVQGEKQTVAASDAYDDSYLGMFTVCFSYVLYAELVAGVPRGAHNFGYVSIQCLCQICEFMCMHRLDDVLVGAPLYMDREFESKPREVGRVYLYLQEDVLLFSPPMTLTGKHLFGRYGSAIAPLGDINQDGYLDVAIGAPFAGEDRGGRVFIYNGQKSGLMLQACQVLKGDWASSGVPAGFGFTLRGDSDLDNNQYPDLLVGAFGVSKIVAYRARPVVTVDAQLILTPRILNPEDKSCRMPNSDDMVTCLSVNVCAKISGIGIPDYVALRMDLQLDWLKQRGAVKRILFTDSHQHQRTQQLVLGQGDRQHCHNYSVYLRDEGEFRDKLSPISVTLNYSLDQNSPPPDLQLRPILDHYSKTFHHEQANILLDCGEDNMCIPDLKLSAKMDRTELLIGDDNLLMLTIHAANEGEGAYEAELHVTLPPEADYIGVERRHEDLQRLNCEHRTENDTRVVVCDLGNPMVADTNLSVGLRFSVQRLEDAPPTIGFELQIHRYSKYYPSFHPYANYRSTSSFFVLQVSIIVSHPAQVVLPFPRWEPKEKPVREDEVGPQVQHIYELHNKGPSSISRTVLEVGWPSRFREEHLLYVLQIITDGPVHCSVNGSLNPLKLEDTPELLGFLRNSSAPTRHRRSVSTAQSYNSKILNCSNINCLMVECVVDRLDRGQSAVIKFRSRLWAHTFLQRRNDHYTLNSTVSFQVMAMPYRIKADSLPHQSKSVNKTLEEINNFCYPRDQILIICSLYFFLFLTRLVPCALLFQCGFFDRARPPKDDDVSDREQLTAEKSTDA
uniref:Integrin, alpha 8 n=1 Tax=Cyprinus carpio TaxID=7962 RepID=A0A8C1XKE2_CYPCA